MFVGEGKREGGTRGVYILFWLGNSTTQNPRDVPVIDYTGNPKPKRCLREPSIMGIYQEMACEPFVK